MKTITYLLSTIVVLLFLAMTNNICAQTNTDLVKAKAFEVLKSKCNICHQSWNPRRVFTVDNMNAYAEKINKQVFIKERMPKGKATSLSEIDKKVLLDWLNTQIASVNR